MFAGADKVKVFAFNFVHHGVHFFKAHNAGNNIAANHKRRNAIGKALVYHKIAGICKNRAVHTGNVAHKIIESFAGDLSGSFFINSVEFCHNVGMIRNFKVGVGLFSELLNLNVFAVVLAYGNRRVYDIRNLHHKGFYLGFKLVFLCFKLCKALRFLGDKLFHLHGFLFFALSHEHADFLADFVSVCAKLAGLGVCGAFLLIKADNLVHHGNLLIFKFLSDVLFYEFGIFS